MGNLGRRQSILGLAGNQSLILPIKREIARYIHYYPLGMAYSNGYLVIGEGFDCNENTFASWVFEYLDAIIKVRNWWGCISI
ncbi:MAG: hypothetical protein LUQ22_06390 [Methanotrichaceae archaeon]|nr:hypothetical protein [Methanotrichaceae archaeon]